jgi:hypothetical protein
MSEGPQSDAGRARGITLRSMEIAVAVIVFAIGALVVYDSRRLGSSWGTDGPEAGYFPFYIGLIICVSAVAILRRAIWGRSIQRDAIFVEWQALRQVLSVLIPAALYILGIQLVGFYVASAIYIAAFMVWLGKYGLIRSVLVGFAVSALAFVTFEVWFQVPLYKGAIDPLAFLGY